jgi:hypothetical protein
VSGFPDPVEVVAEAIDPCDVMENHIFEAERALTALVERGWRVVRTEPTKVISVPESWWEDRIVHEWEPSSEMTS